MRIWPSVFSKWVFRSCTLVPETLQSSSWRSGMLPARRSVSATTISSTPMRCARRGRVSSSARIRWAGTAASFSLGPGTKPTMSAFGSFLASVASTSLAAVPAPKIRMRVRADAAAEACESQARRSTSAEMPAMTDSCTVRPSDEPAGSNPKISQASGNSTSSTSSARTIERPTLSREDDS